MIIADTASVYTDEKSRVVVQLQRKFIKKVGCEPQFISLLIAQK